MIVFAVIAALIAGMVARPADLSKGQMKAVFTPKIERWEVTIIRADKTSEIKTYEMAVKP